MTEKMLIYAQGGGMEDYDADKSDRIVARLEAANRRLSALIAGVVESAPFQRTRAADQTEPRKSTTPAPQRADAGNRP